MDETNLELMKNYNYTFEKLFMISATKSEENELEKIIDNAFKRWYQVDDIPDNSQWTWIDTYDNVKMTLIHGSARLDDYRGENLDWWDERIHSGDDFLSQWGMYLSMRGFLKNLGMLSYSNHHILEHNSNTLVKAINRLFIHYIEDEVQKQRREKKIKTQSK